MNQNYGLYKGATRMQKLYHGEDKIYHVYKGDELVWRDRAYEKGQTVFESAAGKEQQIFFDAGVYDIYCIGGGGAAGMRGVYDDRGYGWGGGSGGGFIGRITISEGTRKVVVGSANNNAKPQGGNTNTLNPDDMTTHDSYIEGVLRCGGGGAGSTSGVGAAGAAPVFDIQPISSTLNRAGNAGSYNSGGKGSAPAAYCAGGASIYENYGTGQGCYTSEYSARRSWVDGTAGYMKIVYVEDIE